MTKKRSGIGKENCGRTPCELSSIRAVGLPRNWLILTDGIDQGRIQGFLMRVCWGGGWGDLKFDLKYTDYYYYYYYYYYDHDDYYYLFVLFLTPEP